MKINKNIILFLVTIYGMQTYKEDSKEQDESYQYHYYKKLLEIKKTINYLITRFSEYLLFYKWIIIKHF